ncbi:MAG: flagellar hook-length control protein FliK [Alkalimonas sp.]|nr:flagellar hook-length control protein FliK [Alkalimonas sp.]
MANALHMFLMSGASGALVSERAAVEASMDTAVESATFSDTLSELSQGITLTERQKAAIHTAMHAAADSEDVPDPDALKAILVDADSSAKEKDSARAWLAIIQHGKETSAELSSSAKKADVAKPDSLVITARVGVVSEKDTDSDDSETEQKHESKNWAQPTDHSKGIAKGDASPATPLKAKSDASEDAEKSTSAEQKLQAAGKASEADDKKQPDDKPVERTNQMAAVASAVKTDASVQDNDESETKDGNEAEDAKEAKDVFKAQAGHIKGASGSESSSAADSRDQQLQRVTAMQNNGAASDINPKAVDESKQSSTVASKDSASLQSGSAAMLESEVSPETELEGFVLEPRLATLARAEASSGQQTLAGATQARAEQAQAVVNSASSAGQSGAEDKSQRQASAMTQEQWLQMQSESGKGRELQQDQDIPRNFSVPEQHARAVAGLGGIPQQESGTSINPTNSNLASAQFVQTQGSASQSQLTMTQVNEALRQPMNLLAADAAGQLRERLVMMARNSIHSAEIKLEPAELGSMTIRVNMQQDQASVQFLVQQAHAKEVLEQQLPRLRDMLQEQGIQLAEGQVEQHGSKQQQGDGRGKGQQTGDNNDTDLSTPTAISTASSDRLVDYYA